MKKTLFFSAIAHSILAICCAGLIFFTSNHSALAQATTESDIVVTGEEVPSAYGAPPGLSRSRFSNTTQAYVLPPWSFFFGELLRAKGFVMDHQIIFSLKRSKWVCLIASMWRRNHSSNDLTVVAARRQ